MTDTSASHAPPKVDPEGLQLRASPRRAARFKRGVIIAIAALGSGAVLGVTMMALQGPALRLGEQVEELYNTERKPTPEGLETLPGDYSQVKPQTPVLGPPLPGDLGGPILERQRQLGIAPGQEVSAEEQRLAQQAIEARESEVFFRIDNRSSMISAVGTGQGARAQPETALPQSGAGSRRLPWHQPKATRTTSSASWTLSAGATQARSTIRTPCKPRPRPIRSWPAA